VTSHAFAIDIKKGSSQDPCLLQETKRVKKKKKSNLNPACWLLAPLQKRSSFYMNRRSVSGVGRVYRCKIARILPYSQLAFWALLEAITGDPLPSATFAKERYCNFTLSALSKGFTTYHPFKHCAVTTA